MDVGSPVGAFVDEAKLEVGLMVVGLAGGLLVMYSRSHRNSTSMHGVDAYTMTYNVRSDVEALRGPTTSLVEPPLLKASYEFNVGWEPNLAYKSGLPLPLVVRHVIMFDEGTAM